MHVIAIIGSARRNGTVARICRKVLEGAQDSGHSTEEVNLFDYQIESCRGCWSCAGSGSCPIPDDFAGLFERVRIADAVVLGSPCYWGNISAPMKAFFDRHTGYAMLSPVDAPEFSTLKPSRKLAKLRELAVRFGPREGLAGKRFVLVTALTDPFPVSWLSRDLPQTLGALRTYVKNLKGVERGAIVCSDTLFRFQSGKEARLLAKARAIGARLAR